MTTPSKPESDETPPESPNRRLAAHLTAQEAADIRELRAVVGEDRVPDPTPFVLQSKPCSRTTRRAIANQVTRHQEATARLQRRNERLVQRHQAELNRIAQDAALDEGIDLQCYHLNLTTDTPYWSPK